MPLWRSLLESGATGDDDDTASTGTDELKSALSSGPLRGRFWWRSFPRGPCRRGVGRQSPV
jgi:hypothetical protein